MNNGIIFSGSGWDDYVSWQTEDRKTLRRINKLIQSIQRDGLHRGLGKPEPLKGDLSGFWSRRINEKDRLIYAMDPSGRVYIAACENHYSDR